MVVKLWEMKCLAFTRKDVVGGDIVYMNGLHRKNKFADATQLVIQDNDMAQVFYFDLLQADQNGEYPVYKIFGDQKVKYADDFLGFLSGRILDKYYQAPLGAPGL